MESANVLVVDCGDPISPSKMKCAERFFVDCGETVDSCKEVEDATDELSKTVEIPALAIAEAVTEELSKENARLKQKLECLEAILLGSAAQQGGGTCLQAKTRARRVSCPVKSPPTIPEFEPVYHQIRRSPCTIIPNGCLPGTPPDEEEPSPEESRRCRRSTVPTLDCGPSRPSTTSSRPSTTPQIDCGEDEGDSDLHSAEGNHEPELFRDSDSESEMMPDPLSTPGTMPVLDEKRRRDESVCGCVIA